MTRRLVTTLDAYARLLDARFAFSRSHKLPGSKGKLREDAVAEFLEAFVPVDHAVATNVFATTADGDEYPNEIDLVIHNSQRGGLWKLDAFGENSICNFEGIAVAVEIKSVLNVKEMLNAKRKSLELKAFCEERDISAPPFVLFSFDVAPSDNGGWLGEDEIHDEALSSALPFDMVVCPRVLCYVSADHDLFGFGLERGLSSSEAAGDGSVWDRIVATRDADSRYSRRFTGLGTSAGERLLAFAAFVSDLSGNNQHTAALVSSAIKPRRSPIHEDADVI
ncbi:MAG: DUF6602 domain-containing protein [Paracoccus sp. (in: a-proteobacteria)]